MFRFQALLIIFWATIRLQNRGEAVCDPSVSDPTGSQANHLPLTGEAMAMTYLRHVSGAKRTSMGKISRRPRNMSKHRTALLIILSPETPMVKVFESMP